MDNAETLIGWVKDALLDRLEFLLSSIVTRYISRIFSYC